MEKLCCGATRSGHLAAREPGKGGFLLEEATFSASILELCCQREQMLWLQWTFLFTWVETSIKGFKPGDC